MHRTRFVLVPELRIDELAAYHYDVVASLRMYFSPASPVFRTRFAGRSGEMARTMESRLVESDFRSALTVLTGLEAYFRTDFNERCRRRLKDGLSVCFREIERNVERDQRGTPVSLDSILDGWKIAHGVSAREIGVVRGAFKFRHWLAHGRYWSPKLGYKYDFNGIYLMAKTVVSTFPSTL